MLIYVRRSGKIFPRNRRSFADVVGGLPKLSISADGKTYTSGPGLKPGSTANLYSEQGTKVATATVDSGGIATFTLTDALPPGSRPTWDAVLNVKVGTVPETSNSHGSYPGGSEDNYADYTDPNNAYLVALIAV